MITITLGALITGPEPMNVVAPLGSIVTFTCVVNTTETPAGTTLIGINTDGLVTWLVNGTVLAPNTDQNVIVNGSLQIGTRQLTVTQDYLTGVPVQCQVIVLLSNGDTMRFRTNNATLTAYGEHVYILISSALDVHCTHTLSHISAGPPEAPSNLTSTQSGGNAQILSWSAPSSPVQLHYTVTVWTNTSTITMFNTSSTTITISRDNITTSDSTSECDQYVWSVTAINPAGSSLQANYSSFFMLESGVYFRYKCH